MLTNEGANLLWEIATGDSTDSLKGGSLLVSDGRLTAQIPFDQEPEVDGASIALAGTFDEESANFEWATVEVLSKNGVVVDREMKDNGRKTAGAVWTLETTLDLGEPADG